MCTCLAAWTLEHASNHVQGLHPNSEHDRFSCLLACAHCRLPAAMSLWHPAAREHNMTGCTALHGQ